MPAPGSSLSDRLQKLFEEVVDLDPESRAARLDRASDPELRREVEALLAAAEAAEDYFEDLSAAISAAGELELDSAAAPRVEIGPYRTTSLLGSGGMGVVYRAQRIDGQFDKQVALKLLHLDMHMPQARARFLAERQILARIEHPGIARLLDGGVTDEGRPWFVMELVDGLPITDFRRQRSLSLDDTIDLFRQAVDAVAYLHRSLIVHRDLKPSNILVDTEGRVKLVDFGIAKLTDTAEGSVTVTGQRLLTPRYAAPEQIAGEPITTATDVYGLGAVLYELLTGRPPREDEQTGTASGSSIRAKTTAPSAVLRERSEFKTKLPWRSLGGDLDNICLKALRVEPERRYPSAEQMDRDLERYRQGLPVSARPSTWRYRIARFVRRHRAGVSVALAVLLLLAAGLARERGLRRQAQQQAARAETVVSLLGDLITSADPAHSRGQEVTVSEVVDRAEAALADNPALADEPGVEAKVRLVLGRTYASLGRSNEARRQFELAIRLGGGIESTDDTTLAAAEELARLLRDLDPDRAQNILRRVVAVRRNTLGPGHDLTLSATASLSRVLRSPEHVAEAETLDRQVLDQRRLTLGPNHLKSLLAQNSLAGTLFNTERYDEAAELYLDAFNRAQASLGEDHPDTLRFGSNLAASYSALGRYSASEEIQRQILATRLRVLGEDHHSTGLSLHNLGILLLRQARYQEAEPIFRRAVAARRESQSGSLYSQSFLADTLREMGRFDEAEAAYEDALRKQREFGSDYPDTWRTTFGLAELHLAQGELERAAELAGEAHENYLRIYGGEHLQVAVSLVLLSEVDRRLGHLEDAVKRAERAVHIVETSLPRNHPSVIDARLQMARVRLAAGEPVQAERLSELVRARVDRLGRDHPAAREAQELLTAVEETLGGD